MYLIFGGKNLPIFTYFLAWDSAEASVDMAEASGFGRTRFYVVRSFTIIYLDAGYWYNDFSPWVPSTLFKTVVSSRLKNEDKTQCGNLPSPFFRKNYVIIIPILL